MTEPRQIGAVEVRVELPEERVFFCEGAQKFVRWPEHFWPLYCPICGRAVHADLSAHHEMIFDHPKTAGDVLGDVLIGVPHRISDHRPGQGIKFDADYPDPKAWRLDELEEKERIRREEEIGDMGGGG